MIHLVPNWAHHYDEFWNAIRARNLWFIKIRYVFAIGLSFFLLIGEFLFDLQFTSKQIYAIFSISVLILIYNLIIHSTRSKIQSIPGKFNALHLSLVQMILDLSSLLILIYYTGIIESPVYLFAIFQSIIGSLILPGHVVYLIVGMYVVVFSGMIILQNTGVIHSHLIIGLCGDVHLHNMNYIILFIMMYSSMLIFSVYLANKIAYQLYKREQQLRQSLIQIQDMEQQKQKYIMGIVHEVKTPIAAMQSMTDLILNGYLGEISDKLKEKINRINQRSGEALTLVNDVLFISKLKLMSITSAESINMHELINNLLSQFENDYNSKNIDVRVNVFPNTSLSVHADKIFIELAVKNIISNAIKYTPENGSILIEINEISESLVIEISDNGLGIPQNEIENIFKEFYRAKNAKKSNIEGSGLGLSLVKQIIELHYGELEINSPSKIGNADNPGTVVTIRLPYKSPLGKLTNNNSVNQVN